LIAVAVVLGGVWSLRVQTLAGELRPVGSAQGRALTST